MLEIDQRRYHMFRSNTWMYRVLVAVAILGLVAVSAAAQAKPAQPPVKEKVVNEVTLSEVQSVLGMARDDHSGVSDFSQGDTGQVIIAYHYYDVDESNYENDFAMDITPKIQQMFKRFKNFDKVRFEVVTNNPAAPPLWIPFAGFDIDRKTIEQLHYTYFVAKYVLDQVLKNKKWS
jgi:hypothetical protein